MANVVALLGDSAIDNHSYVNGPDVSEQLRRLASGWDVVRLAKDGATVREVTYQLRQLPRGTTHLVLSVGGNNALGQASILSAAVGSISEALIELGRVREEFRLRYSRMLDLIKECNLPTVACTIYEPRYDDRRYRTIVAVALTAFNDVITRETVTRGCDIIDLRVMFDNDAYFANPIEPSSEGGLRLAHSFMSFMSGNRPRASLFL
jgi:hypothetical protein